MKSHALTIATLLISFQAHATKDPVPSPQPAPTATGIGLGVGVGMAEGGDAVALAQGGKGGAADARSTSVSGASAQSGDSVSRSSSISGDSSASVSGLVSESNNSQSQEASASNNGSNVNITSSYRAVRNAPSVALGSVYPTAGCQGGVGIGGSGVNGSGLLNFSFTKKECETVVLAQNFAALGMPDVSCEILKTTKAWKRAVERNPNLAAHCEPKPEVVADATGSAPVTAPPDMSQYATKEEVDRMFRRAVSK